jgi:hypothetical protein
MTTLAACDAPERHTVSDPETGEKVNLELGSRASVPSDMPDFAPLYPGARIESSMSGMASAQAGQTRGGMVTFRVADPVTAVASFYRGVLERSDLAVRNEINMNGTLMLTGNRSDNPDHGLQVTIAPEEDGTGSFVTLVYSLGEG